MGSSGWLRSGGHTSTANVSDPIAAAWLSHRYSQISSVWASPGAVSRAGIRAFTRSGCSVYHCANPVCSSRMSPGW